MAYNIFTFKGNVTVENGFTSHSKAFGVTFPKLL